MKYRVLIFYYYNELLTIIVLKFLSGEYTIVRVINNYRFFASVKKVILFCRLEERILVITL